MRGLRACPVTETVWWLEWVDDPIALAGTGRRVGTLDDVRELVRDRYEHAKFEGPYLGDQGSRLSKILVRLRDQLVGIIREFPADFQEKDRNQVIARKVDDVRAGRLSYEDYQAQVGKDWAGL